MQRHRRHDDTDESGKSNDTERGNNDGESDESDTGNDNSQSACNTAESNVRSATWNSASGVDNREYGVTSVDSVDNVILDGASGTRIGRGSDRATLWESGGRGDQGAGERGSTAEIWVFAVVRTILGCAVSGA